MPAKATTPKPLQFVKTSDGTGVRIIVGNSPAPAATLYTRHLKEIGPLLGMDYAALEKTTGQAIQQLQDDAQRMNSNAQKLEQERDHARNLVVERNADMKVLRTILMDALGIPPENRAGYPLIEAAESLATGYANAQGEIDALRRDLLRVKDEASQLSKDLAAEQGTSRQLRNALESEQLQNKAHVHARRWGFWVGLLAAIATALAALGFAGVFRGGQPR